MRSTTQNPTIDYNQNKEDIKYLNPIIEEDLVAEKASKSDDDLNEKSDKEKMYDDDYELSEPNEHENKIKIYKYLKQFLII